jgi:hypothetical protein
MADTIDIPGLINAVLAILGLVGVPALLVYFTKAKSKVKALRGFFDELDDDLADDHLTQEEYAKLVEKGKEIVSA